MSSKATSSSGEQSGDPMRREGTILDQRYRLGKPLGAGPIHTAHAAVDILEEQDVCLKIPRPKFRRNEGFSMRYRRDLLDVMMLSDRNWLTPLQLAEHDGVPIQVLPLVDGLTFAEWYEKSQRNESRLIQVLLKAFQALSRLHKATNRTHGSIKPSNIYVCHNDEPLFADLAATGRLEDHFAEKALSGEPVYCSPEQLCGERADAASDVYSLGLVFYEALARRHPYFGPLNDNPASGGPELLLTSLLGQLQDRPTPPSNFAEDVPRWADRFLARCLHPHPSERFATAQEAFDWLKSHAKQTTPLDRRQKTLPPAGREREMAFLMEQLERILKGRQGGSMVRLRGDVGCGKTRLLRWLMEQAAERSVRVVLVETTPESGLHLQSVIGALSQDFPELQDDSQPVVESLLSIALDEPIMMVIRDIQQSDDTLVEFLKELQSVLPDIPLLLLLVDEETTFRSEDMRAFVAGLQQSLRLDALNRRGIANLIEELTWTTPNPSVTSWVHQVSRGNALHAVLLVEYLQAQGLVSDALELSWTSSPPTERPTLETVIAWKLSGLSPLAQNIMETAAVLGHPFRLSTLNAITYRQEEEVDQALGEAVGKGLVEITQQSGGAISYSWKHPKFRSALLDTLPVRRKMRIHRLAAAFYSRGVPEPAKMAYHFLQAGDTPELFYWGSLAVEKAYSLRRRGECNYWMNVLLSRVPEQEWLGPDIQRARREVSRDQAESVDLTLWPEWLRCLSGRSHKLQASDDCFLRTQHALSSRLEWKVWRDEVVELLEELGKVNDSRTPRAVALLRQEWLSRGGGRELFPTKTY